MTSGTALIFVVKISLLTHLTQSLKYQAGITDFTPAEGGGGGGGGGGGVHIKVMW